MAMMKQIFCGHCEIRQYGECCDRCGMKTSTHAKQLVPVAHLSDSFIRNKSKRLAGVEIEVSKYKAGKKASAIARSESCALMSDGSVPEGFELCTNPANGDRFVKKIEDICSVLKEAKCVADDKSGLHVHIDCHDFSWHELRRLIMIYARIEPALYMIIDKRRALSRYSKMYGAGLAEMVSDPSTAKRDIMSLVFGDQRNSSFAQGFSKGSHGSDRYYGLNLSSWWIRGTVEFRMHHGTTQAYKIVHWAKLLLSLADTAARCTDSEANNWPAGTAGLLKLCPDENTSWYVALRYQYFQLMRLEKEEAKRAKKRLSRVATSGATEDAGNSSDEHDF